jgi:hypothetical protein
MTISRAQLVDVSITPWYHVLSKTVRGARLLAEGQEDRRPGLQNRLEELSRLFAIEIAAFAVLDNVVQVLVRLSPERSDEWSDEELARRWTSLHPPRSSDRQPLEPVQDWIRQQTADAKNLAKCRQRLADLAWFMKCLREPIARRANREDGCRGAFWQSRYKSIAILDDKAVLASCVFIDLCPMAAGLASSPKQSAFTSLRWRSQHASKTAPSAKRQSVTADSRPEEWLCPLDTKLARNFRRTGLLKDLTLDGYLQLVNWTARSVLQGQSRSSSQAMAVLERLEVRPEIWQATLKNLFSESRQAGVAFSFSRQRLGEAARRRGCRRLANTKGCPTIPEEPCS